ncbi:MAG: DUF308 domain-containing protein [Prevotellaceae bacterium]|jgi:uncharacterized membrane protein HdeD (DUF308 family)|nr:DUF308 domain-containing protein [Prevotellaceae bacterium]
MKTFSNNSTWLLVLIFGVALVALSVAIFVNAEKVLGLLIYVAGFALCGMGAALAVAAFLPNRKGERPRLLTLAIGNALLGIFVMLFSSFALIFVGVALALDGAGAVLKALHHKKEEGESRLAEIFLGLTFFALGLVFVIFSSTILQLVGITLGLLPLIVGLTLIIVALLTRSSQKSKLNAITNGAPSDIDDGARRQ